MGVCLRVHLQRRAVEASSLARVERALEGVWRAPRLLASVLLCALCGKISPPRFPINQSVCDMTRAQIVFCLLTTLPLTARGEPPNIVFILADDLGIGDVKCYGGDRCLIDTPNISDHLPDCRNSGT